MHRKKIVIIALSIFWAQILTFSGTLLSREARASGVSGLGADVTGSSASSMLSSSAPTSRYNPLGGPPYPVNPDSYFTDDYGNILMYVNLIGKVAHPGQFIVREDADFGTMLTLCGGVQDDANLRKVLLIRARPDEDGKQVYIVNLKLFMKRGDRSNFVILKPNDTIIIPQKGFSLYQVAKWASAIYPFYNLYDILAPSN